MEAGPQRLWGPDVNVSQITKLTSQSPNAKYPVIPNLVTITLQSRGENGRLIVFTRL